MKPLTQASRTAQYLFGSALGALWLLCGACAEAPTAHKLPSLGSEKARQAYYRAHCIQNADGPIVTVQGRVVDARDPDAGLAYESPAGRLVTYQPTSSVGNLAAKTWMLPLGTTAVGGAVGGIIGILSLLNLDANQSNPVDFAVVGAGIGAAAGVVAASIVTVNLPRIVSEKNLRKADRYNRRLWKDLHLTVEPESRVPRGEEIRLSMSF